MIEKIVRDAEKEAERIAEEGRREAASIVADYERRAEIDKAEMLDRAALEAAALKERLISAAELAVRDKKLAAKQQLIDRVLAAAKQQLSDMDDLQYTAFLSKQLNGIALPEGDGVVEIVVPSRYREKLNVKSIHPRLCVSQSNRRINDGFALVFPDFESNCALEALISARRDELEKIAMEMLF